MSPQNRFGVAVIAREEHLDRSYQARSPINICARLFENNERGSGTRILDLTDKSQRVAQTMHLGKTIDDIPH